MKLVCVSNVLNNHSKSLCDEFYKTYKDDFCFIATQPYISKENLKGGKVEDFINEPYWVDGYSSKDKTIESLKICEEADVVLQFAAPDNYVRRRLKNNKLTFRVSERFYTGSKKDILRWIKYFCRYYSVKNKMLFFLASGAYASYDMRSAFAFKNKTYKWAYFPVIYKTESDIQIIKEVKKFEFLWVGRFIDLKKPEICIEIGKYLRNKGMNFTITMVGDGVEFDKIKKLVVENSLEKYFIFKGVKTNLEVQSMMDTADFLIFSSNKSEGWGAVLNEGMANRCIPITSYAPGSVPFLIENGINGYIFDPDNLETLKKTLDKAVSLTVEDRNNMKNKSQATILKIWSPKNAVHNLMMLIDSINNGDKNPIKMGPASNAEIFNEKEFLDSLKTDK